MFKENYHVIGVMSGTSLDGIDVAELFLHHEDNTWSFTFGHTGTFPYESDWIIQLQDAINYSTEQLQNLNTSYTHYLSKIIKAFINKHQIQNIDAVCSHGHTVLHQPENGITLQIGNLSHIAKLTNQTVVCDFRVQDVQLGGQGAPLVPIGDRLLFLEFDFCLNLGGFANISFEKTGNRIAYDICPVNTVLNYWAEQKGLPYDDQGSLASSGKLNEELYKRLNELEFYQLHAPKSLGIEFLNLKIHPLFKSFQITPEDALRTFTEHIAFQIGKSLPSEECKILVTGGGAYNCFLMDRIKNIHPKLEILIPEKEIIEYKEALIFGLLGVLKLRKEINVLSSVTGATSDHSSGNIFLP
ncbi:MAG: anhydro-N-acetylmuramic acid kinase [Flavobacterium sp.]